MAKNDTRAPANAKADKAGGARPKGGMPFEENPMGDQLHDLSNRSSSPQRPKPPIDPSANAPKPSGPLNEAERGQGGELHQRGGPALTDNHGHPISDNQNSLKAGVRGPTLLEDFLLREKIFHFDHERIPERIVHARGTAAKGFFEATADISKLSKAAVFKKGTRTEVVTRFSTVAGERGSKDTPRDVRGFAVKMYTTEGNWDLVGNNMPVFFIQDAIKFPDLVHSVKPEADRAFPQAASAHDTFWDFISLMPESSHMVMWLMSDFALPRSYRTMQGFGVHTWRLVNDAGEGTLVKFHWKPRAGTQSTCWDEAVKISGADPDYHRRDLWEAIERGDYPQWDLGIQVIDLDWAAKQPYDVLDASKLIPEEEVPIQFIGTMTLDRNVDNFFAETEQVAFLPSNVPPGIDFSNDPLLQGRLFSYLDTQKSRLGTTNFHQIPVNAPRCPFNNFQRDGLMQTLVPKGRATYEPNGLGENGEDPGPRSTPAGFRTFAANGEDNDRTLKVRARSESFSDHYSQARMFFASQSPIEQAHIASALVFELSKCEIERVRERAMSNLRNIDEGLAQRVADGLAMPLPPASEAAKAPLDLPTSDALSIVKQGDPPMKGRLIGVLIADGSDKKEVDAVTSAIKAGGGTPFLVAPKIGEVKLEGGSLKADGQLAGSPSVLFDAVAVVLSEDGATMLTKEGAAVQFVMDAFGHVKTIGHNAGAKALLDKAGVEPDAGVTDLKSFANVAPKRHWDREPKVRMLA